MPFLVKDLIDEHRKPVIVHEEDSLQVALTRMTEHDYSQLPVVDEEKHCLGVVTSDSILRAIKTFAVTPNNLSVRDAKTRVAVFHEEDDLFEMLDDLRDSYAVLIVDEEKRVIGVVTGYDATEYFRRRTEDMMFVEDIEFMLRDYVQAAHTNGSGEIDGAALQQSIQQCARGASTNRKRFFTALQRYLERQSPLDGSANSRLIATLATEVFAQVFEADAPKSLDKLTFADYIELLVSKEQWPRYARAFEPLSPEALRYMLEGVRRTRNALAHFHGNVTPEQQDQLKFCLDWLKAHPTSALLPAQTATTEEAPTGELASLTDPGLQPVESVSVEGESELARLDAALEPGDNRYAPLAVYLRGQAPARERVTLSFQEIESILQTPLPPSARKHRAFWANDTVGHVQSRQWLDADWRVASVDMNGEKVTFARIKSRQQAYREFFGPLLSDLRAKAPFTLGKKSDPDGDNWVGVARIPRGQGVAQLTIAWGRGRQLRVGLYLSGWEPETRKRVYDALFAERGAIERELSETWLWDRLEGRQSAYVGVARPYSLSDSAEELAKARAWAVDTVIRFYEIFTPRVEAILRGVS